MRKRVSRPARFASVDNGAIDDLPLLLSVGMLTRLIRAMDGSHITVETMCKQYGEGKVLMTKAMQVLVEHGYVVKYKIQRAHQEVVFEGGTAVTKKGGSWHTVFEVDSIPFTTDDVAASLEDIFRNGNARAVRVEPQRLDPRSSGMQVSDMQDPDTRSRPAEMQDSEPIQGQDPDTSSPTYRFLTVGAPTVGESAALYKTPLEDKISKTLPPPTSSVGAGSNDATPEAPLEEDEEEIFWEDNLLPSPPSQRSRPQERTGGEETSNEGESAERPAVGPEDVRVVLDRLPDLEVAQVTAETPLWGMIASALGSGWPPEALAAVLVKHTDYAKARSKRVLAGWYANAFDHVGEPPRSVVPLCDNPGHQRAPKEDPINGGCFLCNTQAATGPRDKTALKGDDVVETTDAVTAVSLCRQALANRKFNASEPDRTETPALRAWREAEAARTGANDLLRTEV